MNDMGLQCTNFEVLYKDHYVNLCNYAFRYLKNKKIAEDVVQETFYTLWQNKDSLTKVNNMKGYLYKSIYNNCLYYIRKNKKEQEVSDFNFELLEYNYGSDKDALDKIIIDELEVAIQKAVNNLPEQQAKVFRLKRFEDLKNKEIAEELNISIKTVEAHMSKAIQTLKKELTLILPYLIICLFFK